MANKKRNSTILYSVAALFLSLILFFNANRTGFQNPIISSETSEETVRNIPVTINYDKDKYFIQGYDPTVSVRLSGKNRVQLQAEKNEETRHFRVVADLTELKAGTHDVRLKVKNLSNSVTAKVKPATLTVTIEKKASKDFTIDTTDLASRLQSGYELGDYGLSPQKVTVTTGNQTMKEIREIRLSSQFDKINEGVSKKVALVAVNRKGEELAAEIEPESTLVKLNVTAPQKQVNLAAVQTGTPAAGISHYNFQLSKNNATITGSQTLLDAIDSLEVSVDVTGIKEPTTRQVKLTVPDNIHSDVNKVNVNITPVYENTTETKTTTTTTQRKESRSTAQESSAASTEETSSQSSQTSDK